MSQDVLRNVFDHFDQLTELKSHITIQGTVASCIFFASLKSSVSFSFEVGTSVGLGGGGCIQKNVNSLLLSSI